MVMLSVLLYLAVFSFSITNSTSLESLESDEWYYELGVGSCSMKSSMELNTSMPFLAFKVQVSEDLLLVKEPCDSQTIGTIIFLNISDPNDVNVVGKFQKKWEEGRGIYAFYKHNQTLLTIDNKCSEGDRRFLSIYNITANVSQPLLIYNHTYSKGLDGIFCVNNLAFLMFFDEMLILNISIPESPVNVSSLDIPPILEEKPFGFFASKFFVENNHLFYVNQLGQFVIVDISNVSSPQLEADIPIDACAFDIEVVGDYAYVAAGLKGLYVYNISDPSNPSLIARHNFKCTMTVEKVDENLLFVGDGIFGLHAVNVSNPKNITIVASIPSSDRIFDIAVSGNYAFIAEMAAGISIVDLTTMEKIDEVYLGTFYGVNACIGIGASRQGEPPGPYDIADPWISVGFQTNVGAGNNTRNVDVPITVMLTPLIVYNDTNGDGKLTFEYEKYSNNSMLVKRQKITDQVYFVGEFWSLPVIDIGNCTNSTYNGKPAFTFNYTVPNLNLTSNVELEGLSPENIIGNSAKANVTFRIWFVPEENATDQLNATIKIDIFIDLFDVDLAVETDAFSVYIGFNARISFDLVSFPSFSVIEGRDLPSYSLRIADQVAIFRLLDNFTVVAPSQNYTSSINISNEHSWEDYVMSFEHISRTVLGMNFLNVSSNATRILYDPELDLFVNLAPAEAPPETDTIPPFIGTPTQDPPSDAVMPEQEVTVMVEVTDSQSGVKNVTLLYTTDNGTSWDAEAMEYNSTSGLYQATIPPQPLGTWVKYKIIAYDNAENPAVNDNAGEYYVYQVIQELSAAVLVMIISLVSTIFFIKEFR